MTLPLSPQQLLFIVIGATLLLAVLRVWRIALLALLVHYAALGGLTLPLEPPVRGGLRIFTGGLITLVLFLTARSVEREAVPIEGDRVGRRHISETVFRLAAAALAAVGVFGTPVTGSFPVLPMTLAQAGVWLAAIGLAIMLTSRRPLWIGVGLLTLLSGVETLYPAFDPRILPAGLLGVGSLLVALIVAVIVTITERRNSLTMADK